MEVFVYTPAAQSPERAAAAAMEIEALGYDGMAMADHLFVPSFEGTGPQAYAHALTVLAACAAVTSRIRLETLVMNVLARSPTELAHSVSTLQRLSGGRVDLGLGAGWFRAEFEAAGARFPGPSERLALLTETVGICRALLGRGEAKFSGDHHRVDIPLSAFLPCEMPPIIIGGAAPRSIRAAANLGDRVDLQPNALASGTVDLAIYNTYSAVELDAQVAIVKEIEGSSSRHIPVSESPFVSVTRTAEEGQDRRRELAAAYGVAPEIMERSLGTIVGCAEEVAERLGVYADAGCYRVNLQFLDDISAARLAPQLPYLRDL
jgi:alkanesulfonate monooxygenase SsuD/methylene tetrahydromethanopterin reductase-like flavin-dependent oxidoreductase (luciferase family)